MGDRAEKLAREWIVREIGSEEMPEYNCWHRSLTVAFRAVRDGALEEAAQAASIYSGKTTAETIRDLKQTENCNP